MAKGNIPVFRSGDGGLTRYLEDTQRRLQISARLRPSGVRRNLRRRSAGPTEQPSTVLALFLRSQTEPVEVRDLSVPRGRR